MIVRLQKNCVKLFPSMHWFFRILAVVVFLAGSFLSYSFLKIKKIECVSQYTKCSSDLGVGLDKIRKDKIFSTQNEIRNYLSVESLVKKYSIQFMLDGTFIVRIQERNAKYCLSSGDKSYYTDEEAVVIKIDSAKKTNCVSEEGVDYQKGDRLEYKELQFQKLFYELRDLPGIGEAKIEGDAMKVQFRDGVKMFFLYNTDLELSAGKAYYIASQFDIIKEYIINKGYTSVSEVDFRFNNPIIRAI